VHELVIGNNLIETETRGFDKYRTKRRNLWGWR